MKFKFSKKPGETLELAEAIRQVIVEAADEESIFTTSELTAAMEKYVKDYAAGMATPITAADRKQLGADEKFEFHRVDGYPLTLEEAIGQAIGAGSMCWENMEGTGVFMSVRAKSIAEELTRFVKEYVDGWIAFWAGQKKTIVEAFAELFPSGGWSTDEHPELGNIDEEFASSVVAQVRRLADELEEKHLAKTDLIRAREGLGAAIVKAEPMFGISGFGTNYVEETASRLLVRQAADIEHLKRTLVDEQERLREVLRKDRHILKAELYALFPHEFSIQMLELAEETTVSRVVRKLRETTEELRETIKTVELRDRQITAIESALTGHGGSDVQLSPRDSMYTQAYMMALSIWKASVKLQKMEEGHRAKLALINVALSTANPKPVEKDNPDWTPALEVIYALRQTPEAAEAMHGAQIARLEQWFAKRMPGKDTEGEPVEAAIKLLELMALALPSIWQMVMNAARPVLQALQDAGIEVLPKGTIVYGTTSPRVTGPEKTVQDVRPPAATWQEAAHNG